MKTHFLYGKIQICNSKPAAKGSRASQATSDRSAVTCERCKKMIGIK